ncbi:MAG: hypothetical protein WBW48_16950 [Anaerolineae bacterium]
MSVLVETYDLEVTSPSCDPGAEREVAYSHGRRLPFAHHPGELYAEVDKAGSIAGHWDAALSFWRE